MKNLHLLLAAVFAVMITFSVSVAQNYKSQFSINAAGKAANDKGVTLGWIQEDGTIKNAKGEVTGKIMKNEKEAALLDKLGKKMGAVSGDGVLKDAKGKVMYTISTADENGVCKIIDASGKEVGTVHENYKQQGACMYHCLSKKSK